MAAEEDLAKITKFVFPQTEYSWLATPADLAVIEPVVLGIYVLDKLHGQRESGGPVIFEPIVYDEDQRTYIVSASFSKVAIVGYRSYMALWSRNPALIRYMYLEPTSTTPPRQRLILGILSTLSSLLPRAFADYFQHDRTLLERPLHVPAAAAPLLAQQAEMNDTKRLIIEALQHELRKMIRPSLTNPAVAEYDLGTNLVLQGEAAFSVKWRLPAGSAINVLAAPYLMNKLPGQIDDIFFSIQEEPSVQFGGQPTLYMIVTIFFFPLEGPRRVIDTRTFHSTLDHNPEEDEQDAWLFEVHGPREHEEDPRPARLRGSKRSREAGDAEMVVKVAPDSKRTRHAGEKKEKEEEEEESSSSSSSSHMEQEEKAVTPEPRRRPPPPSTSSSLLSFLTNTLTLSFLRNPPDENEWPGQ